MGYVVKRSSTQNYRATRLRYTPCPNIVVFVAEFIIAEER